MDYLIGFLLFQVLLLGLGLSSMLIAKYVFGKTQLEGTFENVYLYSAFGLIGVVLLGFLANAVVGLHLVFSYAFYLVLFAGGITGAWVFRPKPTTAFLLSFLCMFLLFGFISPVELRQNATVSFGANGDYHNHEKETRLINAEPTSIQRDSLSYHYQPIHSRVGSSYRYPPGAHYLTIFGRNFIHYFVAFPHFTPLHKYYFVYSMLLALLLVRRANPASKFSWLAVVLCFSYPLVHVMVGMDFVSQEISLWLIMLLMFLPIINKKLSLLPLLVLTLGIVYYHSLFLVAPYLLFHVVRLIKQKTWRILGLLLAVSAYLVFHFATNMINIGQEYQGVLQHGYWTKKLEVIHILGAVPYQMNNAYNKESFLALVTQQQRPLLTVAVLVILCIGLIHLIRQCIQQRVWWVLLLLGFELLFILIGINFRWEYISFKVASMASIVLLPVAVLLLDQKKLILQAVMVISFYCLAGLYLRISWFEHNNWLRASNSSLYYSPNFQMIAKDLDKTAVIHRNVYFMSLLADEALYQQLYTNEINNNTLVNIIPSGSMRDVCSIETLATKKVKSVYVEEKACTDGEYLEDWQYSNAFNGKINYYLLSTHTF